VRPRPRRCARRRGLPRWRSSADHWSCTERKPELSLMEGPAFDFRGASGLTRVAGRAGTHCAVTGARGPDTSVAGDRLAGWSGGQAVKASAISIHGRLSGLRRPAVTQFPSTGGLSGPAPPAATQFPSADDFPGAGAGCGDAIPVHGRLFGARAGCGDVNPIHGRLLAARAACGHAIPIHGRHLVVPARPARPASPSRTPSGWRAPDQFVPEITASDSWMHHATKRMVAACKQHSRRSTRCCRR
jgi:hypothetical protein